MNTQELMLTKQNEKKPATKLYWDLICLIAEFCAYTIEDYKTINYFIRIHGMSFANLANELIESGFVPIYHCSPYCAIPTRRRRKIKYNARIYREIYLKKRQDEDILLDVYAKTQEEFIRCAFNPLWMFTLEENESNQQEQVKYYIENHYNDKWFDTDYIENEINEERRCRQEREDYKNGIYDCEYY